MHRFGASPVNLPSCQVMITAHEAQADLHTKVIVTGSIEDLNFYIMIANHNSSRSVAGNVKPACMYLADTCTSVLD